VDGWTYSVTRTTFCGLPENGYGEFPILGKIMCPAGILARSVRRFKGGKLGEIFGEKNVPARRARTV